MSRNGSGNFAPPAASFPAVGGTLIESTKFNNVINDISTALTASIANDGQTTVLANLPMSGFKHTGAAVATANGEYLEYSQRALIPGVNIIINPGFTINQRVYASAAALASGTYGHDRWKAGAGGGDYSFTQLNGNTTITIAANKTLIQVVENKNVQNTAYVLSWTGTALARVGVDSATPSGAYAISPIVITGQTAGTTMSVEFGNGASSGTLGTVKLEAGSTATTFTSRSFQDELILCQRYYEKSYEYAVAPGTVAALGAWEGVNLNAANFYSGAGLNFKVPKMVVPTMTGYSSGTGTANVLYKDTSSVDQGNVGFTAPGINGVRRVDCSNSAMSGTNGIFSTQWVAVAEL